jgi:ankyrin repeat protein
MTPLHYAARAGRASFVAILLEKSVDLNAQSSVRRRVERNLFADMIII